MRKLKRSTSSDSLIMLVGDLDRSLSRNNNEKDDESGEEKILLRAEDDISLANAKLAILMQNKSRRSALPPPPSPFALHLSYSSSSSSSSPSLSRKSDHPSTLDHPLTIDPSGADPSTATKEEMEEGEGEQRSLPPPSPFLSSSLPSFLSRSSPSFLFFS